MHMERHVSTAGWLTLMHLFEVNP